MKCASIARLENSIFNFFQTFAGSTESSQLEKKVHVESSEVNTKALHHGEDMKDQDEPKPKDTTLDDLNMLTKLFPKVDKTTLIDTLLSCNGNTVTAIHNLLSLSKEEPILGTWPMLS